MAQMPTPPNFAEILARVQSERPRAVPRSAPSFNSGIKLPMGNKSSEPLDPLSWLLDIASRPLYSVTEGVESAMESLEEAPETRKKFETGDVAGGLGAIGQQLGRGLTAGARGFFSTAPEDKSYTSDLIEKGTDVLGPQLDPSYRDEQDNVNPVLKGVAGFVGDVALDPLTYIPGAAIAGGINKVAQAGRKVKRAFTPPPAPIAALGKAATEVAPRFAPDIAPPPLPPQFANTASPGLDGLVDGSTAAQRVFGQPAPNRPAFGQQAPKEAQIPRAASEQVLTDPKIQRAKSFLAELSAPDVVEMGLQPLRSFDEWVDDLSKAPGSEKMSVATDTGRVPLKQALVYDEAAGALLPVDDKARRFLATVYDRYRGGHARATQLGGAVDVLGNVRKAPKAPKAQSADAYGRFQRALRQESTLARAEEMLGSHLFNFLKRSTRSDTFDKAVEAVNAVLKRGDVLDRITTTARASMALRAVLNTTGVDVVATNLARKGIPQLGRESQVGARLGNKERAEVRKALTESPVGKVLNRAELAEKNKIARQAIEARRVASEAQKVKKARIAEQVEQRERILRFLPSVVKDHFEHGFKHRTNKGVARSDEAQGVGWGINDKLLNGYFQWNMSQKTLAHWLDKAKEVKPGPRGGKPSYLSGPARARFLDENFTADMRTIEDMLSGEGYQFWMGRSADDAIPLTFTQMLAALKAADPEVIKFFFNESTRVPFTNLQDAIKAAVRPGRAVPAEIERILASELKDAREGVIRNPLSGKKERFNYGFTPKRSKEPFAEWLAKLKRNAPEEGFKYIPNDKRTGVYKTYSAKALRTELANAIVKASDDLYETVNDNAIALGRRYEEEAFDLTKEEIDALVELVDDPTRLGSALDAVAHHVDDIEGLGEMAGATVDGVTMAVARVGEALSKPDLAYARGMARAADAADTATSVSASRGRTPVQIDKASVDARRKYQQKAGDDVAREMRAENPAAIALQRRTLDESVDATEIYEDILARSSRVADPFLRAFKASHGMGNLHQVSLATSNNFAARMAKVNNQLRKASQDFGGPVSPGLQTTAIKAAWDDWRAGRPSVEGAAVEARQFIDSFLAGKFSASDGSINSYQFMRTPAGIEAINAQLRFVNLPESFVFDVKAGADAAKASGRNPLVEVMEQVKTWEVNDPIDVMSKLYGAAEKVAVDAAVAQNLTRWMKNKGLASSEPRAGFVKVHWSGENRYGPMLDPDMYWDKNIAKELSVLDAVSRMSRTPDGQFGKFIREVYDPVQSAWKYAITQLRPGHHIRNGVGDASMTFVAEGTRHAKRSYKDAWKIIGERKQYDDISIAKALEHFGETKLPERGDVLFKGKHGYPDLTVGAAADAMYTHGLISSYAVLEDIVDVGRNSGLKRFLDVATLRHTPVERGIASFSEGREHYARAQHFLQYIYKGIDDGRFKGDLDELFRNAAHQVRKHHPDASMLSNFEAKYMRRVIPFYTWTRFALPAIVEGALVHPGRTLTFPKASFNLAVAMGINPDTLADPFPDDQLFPSFLTEQTFGPQFEVGGNYYGVNPGFASTDVANMLIADPVRGVLGSVSPILRVVPELATGGSMSTGTQIKDTSDYLDSMIPGVNYLSNISGTSATGSAVSLLTTGKLDPQAQVAAGNKTLSDQGLSALNWLLGANVQNMSRPNYINYAEIEKRNREGGPSASF